MPDNNIAEGLATSLKGTKKFVEKQVKNVVDQKADAVINGERVSGLKAPGEWRENVFTRINVTDCASMKQPKKGK